MRQLIEKSSIPLTLTAMRYLRVQLVRQPEPSDPMDPNAPRQLIPECDEQIAKLKAANEACEMAEIERIAISGSLQHAGDKNYQLLLQIAREMRVQVQGNQNDPDYLRLFPKTPSKIANRSSNYGQILLYTASIKSTIEEHPQIYSTLQTYLPQLQSNIAEIQQLLTQRSQAQLAEQREEFNRKMIVRTMQDFYNKAYIRLLMAYNNNKDLVECFFYKFAQTKSKKKADAPETENDAPPSAEA